MMGVACLILRWCIVPHALYAARLTSHDWRTVWWHELGGMKSW